MRARHGAIRLVLEAQAEAGAVGILLAEPTGRKALIGLTREHERETEDEDERVRFHGVSSFTFTDEVQGRRTAGGQ